MLSALKAIIPTFLRRAAKAPAVTRAVQQTVQKVVPAVDEFVPAAAKTLTTQSSTWKDSILNVFKVVKDKGTQFFSWIAKMFKNLKEKMFGVVSQNSDKVSRVVEATSAAAFPIVA